MSDMSSDDRTDQRARAVHAPTLWAGGAATALVAALVVLVGLVIVRDLLDVTVYPTGGGLLGSQTPSLMLYAAVVALAATALLHGLLISTPRALSFFSWIMGLLTILAAIAPFAIDTSWASRVGSAAIYVVTGVAITSLLSGVASSARRRGTSGRRRA
jgi:hypothetical protein